MDFSGSATCAFVEHFFWLNIGISSGFHRIGIPARKAVQSVANAADLSHFSSFGKSSNQERSLGEMILGHYSRRRAA